MNVLLFSVAARLAGVREVKLLPSGPLTKEAFWELLLKDYPQLRGCESSCRLAVDCAFHKDGELIFEKSEVAVLPPVSGG